MFFFGEYKDDVDIYFIYFFFWGGGGWSLQIGLYSRVISMYFRAFS